MSSQPITSLHCLILTNEKRFRTLVTQECMDEMHMLGYIVKSGAAEMEVI